MKTFFTQFKEAVKDTQLSETEKNRMREELVAYMEYKPIRRKRATVSSVQQFPLFPFFRAHHFTGALLIAVLITTSTFGVTFAADGALPGDLLYGIKVNINEEIKSALLSSRESRIEFKKERAERRLVEATQLAVEGRLDDKNKEKVAKLFAAHSEEMVEEVRAAEADDPILAAEASSEFEDSLDTHEAVLARLLVEQEEEVDDDSRELVEQVRTAAMEVEKIREDAEIKIANKESSEEKGENAGTTTPEESEEMVESANMRIRAAQRSKVRAEELYQTVQKEVAKLEEGSSLALQAKAQIEYGESKLETGKTAFIEHEYNEAYNAFKQAATSFQKVTQLLTVAELFSIEIYSENSDETEEKSTIISEGESDLSDERRTELQEIRTGTKDAIDEARALLLTQSGYSIEVLENAHKKLKDAGAYLLRGEIAMVLADYNDAKYLFERSYDIAADVVKILAEESETKDVQDVMPEKPTPQEVPAEGNLKEEEVGTEEADTLILNRTYKEGMHTYTGEIQVPTPCHELDYTVAVAESFPEQASISFTTTAPQSEEFDCIQVIDTKEFEIQFSASEHVNIVDITLNGEPMSWEVLLPEEKEREDSEKEKKVTDHSA